MIKLSIITVCFNNKEGLIKTIDSVKKQTFSNYEFIVIDGGSKDGSFNVLEQNKELFSYWVSEKDNGIYNAMNKGIQKATGEYCLFLNSGDYLLDENTLTNLFSFDYTEDILYGNIIKVRGKQKRIIQYSKELTFLDFYKKEPGIHHQAAFIRRNLFLQFGFYREDTYLIADWIFFFETIVKNNISTQYINEIISICDATGISQKYSLEDISIMKDIKIKREIVELYVPKLILKDYNLFYTGVSKFKRIKTSIFWKLSFFLSLKMFVCWNKRINKVK